MKVNVMSLKISNSLLCKVLQDKEHKPVLHIGLSAIFKDKNCVGSFKLTF